MKLYLTQSDQGDGGWSLHDRDAEDADGIAPTLVSGYAEWDATRDDYAWPTIAQAQAMIDTKQSAN